MENNFGLKPRKAKLLKEEKNETSLEVHTKKEGDKLSLEKKMEICREILNFKEIVSNGVLNELIQLQYFANQDQKAKVNFKNNLDSLVSKHFDNLLERVQKKL